MAPGELVANLIGQTVQTNVLSMDESIEALMAVALGQASALEGIRQAEGWN